MPVAIILDALVCLVALVALLVGLKRGFVWICFRKFRKLAAAFFAVCLAKPLGYLFSELFISDWLTRAIMSLAKIEDTAALSPAEMVAELPTVVRWVADRFHVDVAALAEEAYQSGEGMYYHFLSETSLPIARFLGVILAWIALFIAARIVLRILLSIGTSLMELPVLKQVNALLGACVSVLFSSVFVWLAVQLLVWISGLAPVASLAFMQGFFIESTFITKYIYHFAPLSFLLSL